MIDIQEIQAMVIFSKFSRPILAVLFALMLGIGIAPAASRCNPCNPCRKPVRVVRRCNPCADPCARHRRGFRWFGWFRR